MLVVIPAVVLSVGVIAEDVVGTVLVVTPAVVLSVGAIADADVAITDDVTETAVRSVGASDDAVVATVLGVIPAVVLSVGAIAEVVVAITDDVTETVVLSVGAIADDVVATVLAITDTDDVIDGVKRDDTAPALGAVIVVVVGPDVVAGSSRSVQDTATCLDVFPANVPVTHSSRAEVLTMDEYSVEVRYRVKV